jgi:hypothetical protein
MRANYKRIKNQNKEMQELLEKYSIKYQEMIDFAWESDDHNKLL